MMTPEQFEAWEELVAQAKTYERLFAADTANLSDEDKCEMAVIIQRALREWFAANDKFHELIGEA